MLLEDRQAHDLTHHGGGDVIRRAAKPAAGKLRPAGYRFAAGDQLFVALCELPAAIDPFARCRAFEGHVIDMLGVGLEIIERGSRGDRILVGWMGSDVVDFFAVQIDFPSVTE